MKTEEKFYFSKSNSLIELVIALIGLCIILHFGFESKNLLLENIFFLITFFLFLIITARSVFINIYRVCSKHPALTVTIDGVLLNKALIAQLNDLELNWQNVKSIQDIDYQIPKSSFYQRMTCIESCQQKIEIKHELIEDASLITNVILEFNPFKEKVFSEPQIKDIVRINLAMFVSFLVIFFFVISLFMH